MLPLAISSGDPSGIGLEIALKSWAMRKKCALPVFFLIADPEIVQARIQKFQLSVPIKVIDETSLPTQFEDALFILPLKNRQIDQLGVPSVDNAAGTIEAIERAVALTQKNKASAIVTCPIAKKPLYDAGFSYPGHTEFLAHLANRINATTSHPVMMLAGPSLRTVPVTVHIALRHVMETLTTDLIVETALIVEKDLRCRFGIAKPRISVAGLNPHAGEGGAMGKEDIDIILPAIEILQAQGINIFGPLPSDTMFHAAARETYDVALCMYHDQALIPVKTIGFDDTVNVTLGLPFIRTSPDHGTAFDIADKGIASPKSFMEALKLANQLAIKSRIK